MPCGNGSIGAMAFGGPRQETILLNHESLFYPLYAKPTDVPDMTPYLRDVRQMIAAGQYRQAQAFWNAKLEEHDYGMQRFPSPNPFHPGFDMVVRGKATSTASDYQRSLDVETAEATTTWKEGGVSYKRRLFVSRTDDVVVVLLRGSEPGSVSTEIGLAAHAPQEEIYSKHCGYSKDCALACKAYQGDPITYRVTADQRWLSLRGRYWDGREFGGVARVVPGGGSLEVREERLSITGSDETLVLLKLFVNEPDAGAAMERLRSQISELPAEYGRLFEPHAAEHRALFGRMTLDLAAGGEREMSNTELLARAGEGLMPPALVERLFEYGRYLLICSSRPGGLPANLQGVWSGTWTPSWASCYTIDENVQVCYWQALPGNMPEVTEACFGYFDSLLPDWRTNARRFFGCRGIVCDICHSDHGLKRGAIEFFFWTAGAGWLAQLYHDYYLFTSDREFLEQRAVPFLKEVALFYEDFLIADGDGTYVFSPSVSPENLPRNLRAPDTPLGGIGSGTPTTVNATMDIAVAREVLTNLIRACEILGIEKEGITRWRAMLARLPAYQFGPDGALKEWTHPDLEDRHLHRHMSHVYPLVPGLGVDADEGDTRVREGCRVVLEKKFTRKGDPGAWSWAHQGVGFARLGDGDKALECIRQVSLTCAAENLLSFYREGFPFQLDGNSGFAAVVLEMLLASKPGLVKVLPALPAAWKKGKAQGLLCRGGMEIGIEWDMDRHAINATLTSRSAQNVTVKLPAEIKSLRCDLPESAVGQSPLGPAYRELDLAAGRLVKISAIIRGGART